VIAKDRRGPGDGVSRLRQPRTRPHREQVEGVELDLVVVLSGTQGVEIRDAIRPEHDGLAIEDELLVSVLQRGLDDPGIALRPVIATARDQTNVITVAVNKQSKAVVFYVVQPAGSRRYRIASARNARFKGSKQTQARAARAECESASLSPLNLKYSPSDGPVRRSPSALLSGSDIQASGEITQRQI
jgi:hypothetical protein